MRALIQECLNNHYHHINEITPNRDKTLQHTDNEHDQKWLNLNLRSENSYNHTVPAA